MKTFLFRLAFFLVLSIPSLAQSISGVDQAINGETYTYTFTSSQSYFGYYWTANDGTILQTWTDGSNNYYAQIRWNAIGSKSVRFFDVFSEIAVLYVNVYTPTPPPITSPSSEISTNSFRANWGSVSGATTYFLDVSMSSSFTSYVSGYVGKNTTAISELVTGLSPNTTYYYRVRAIKPGSTTSVNSNVTSTKTSSVQIETLAASNHTSTSFNANWNNIPEATSYLLDVSLNESFSTYLSGYYNLILGSSPSSRSVTGLSAGTVYYYRVRYANTNGVSVNSNVISTITLPLPPVATPASLIASTSFTANWNSSPSATGYRLDVSTNSSFTNSVSGFNNLFVSGTSQSVTGLEGGVTYYYRVRAVNASGASDNSNTISILTLPNPPVVLTATSITTTSFIANWQSSLSATSYRLDVSANSNFIDFVSGYDNRLVTTGTNQAVSGLNMGTTYYYRIRAVNASGISANSGVTSLITLPNSPIAIAATSITANSFTANWNSSPSATSYRLDVSTNSSFTNFVSGFNNLFVSGTSQSVTGLEGGVTYYYRVRTVNASGASDNSNIISILTLPNPPVVLTATSITTTSFIANWQSSLSATSYRLDVSTSSNFVDFVSGYDNRLVTTGTNQVVNGLLGGTVYYFRVRAANGTGLSLNSGSASVQTILQAPVALAPSIVEQNSFFANWTSSVNANSYRIDVSLNSSFTNLLVNNQSYTGSSNSVLINTGVTGSTIYWYRIKAVNDVSESEYSNSVSFFTKPISPQTVAATNITVTSFVANWNDPSITEQYYLDVSTNNSFTTFLDGFESKLVTGRNHLVTGTNEMKTYYYRIRAVNPSGVSAYSNVTEAVNHSHNFVSSISFNKPGISHLAEISNLQPAEYTVSTNYFDGLGRSMQSVTLGGGGNGHDLIQPVAYDAFGREAKKYLPYVHEARDGRYQPTALAVQSIYYTTADKTAHDTAPFSETIFEPSPLNRVVKQGAPGTSWQPDEYQIYTSADHTVKFAYEFNGANEVLRWTYTYPTVTYPLGSVNAGTSNTARFYYPANQLYKNKTKDEQQNEVIEYIDKQGRVVLKRVQAVSGTVSVNDVNYASTYYIYDDFGQLVCVIPPEATKLVTQTSPVSEYFGKTEQVKYDFLSRWAFRYAYDKRKRMSQKQVPGAGAVFMVYDKRDRLVMTQDGNQRPPRQWTFTKYDELNRPILTGIKDTTGVTQEIMQSVVDNFYAAIDTDKPWRKWGERYVGNVPGNVHGYTNDSYPEVTSIDNLDVNRYLTVMYYDDYSFRDQWNGNYAYVNEGLSAEVNGTNYAQDATEFLRVKGLVTGTKTKVLDEGITGGASWLKAINYYDDKYRTVQSLSDNYKGGLDRVSNVYDFSGKLLTSKATHSTMNVSWKDRVQVSVKGNMIQAGSAVSGWGTAGTISVQQLAAGHDGWMEVTAFETNRNRMVGLSDQNVNEHYFSIDYAFQLSASATLHIYENGSSKGTISGGYKQGDVLKITRTGTVIRYYRNNELVYTSLTPSSTVLMVDASFFSANSTLTNVRTSFSVASKSTTRRFSYDHAGRLINTWHTLNDNDEVLLAHNEYNELGQLIDKKLHSSVADASDAKQSVDYRYTIRGWLESINNAQLAIDNVNDDANDYFGMQLAYNTDLGTGNASHLQFNGNISATKWSNHYGLSGIKENAYNYTYDAMNRLKTADFKQKVGSTWGLAQYRDANGNMQYVNAFSEHISEYDLNGNIKFLQRRGQDGQLIDDLTYNYQTGGTAAPSNKLMRVTDAAIDTEGFKEVVNTASDDYEYDDNGNLIWDRNKGGQDVLKNGEFDSGLTDWIPGGEVTRGTVSNGELLITASVNSTSFAITQNDIAKTGSLHPYVVIIDMEQTSGSGNLSINIGGGTPVTLSGTGKKVITVTAGASHYLYVMATYTFTGKIKSIQVKALAVIAYNYLNLPETVTMGKEGLIRYIYTATGQKLAQVVVDKGITKRTDYSGEYIYQNDTLQFINHEEGRVVMTGVDPEYQYHLKDHLGNVRVTFTTKHETESAIATLETANENAELGKFLYYDEAVKINSTLFDHTNSGATQYSTRLSGSPNELTGLAKSISVMPGDTIRTEVYAKYLDGNTSNWTTALTNFMAAIAGGTAPTGTFVDGGATGSTGGTTPSFIGLLDKGDETGNAPKAYLNYLIFDKNYVLLNGGFVRMSENAREYGQDGAHEKLAAEFVITEPGYVYIYLSNDNAALGGALTEVYFDDFSVAHAKSPVIETTDYYPYGAIASVYSRESSLKNRFKYQSKELITDLGLEQYDFGPRQYDPWGVFTTTQDPLAEEFYSYSPYSWAVGNPMRFIDPSGMAALDITILGANNSSVTIETDLVDISVDASSLGVDFGGNYSIGGSDVVHAALDIAGVFDPTGVADAANASLYAAEGGSWGNIFISAAGVIPFAGDLAKVGRIGKSVDKVVGAVKTADKASDGTKTAKQLLKEGRSGAQAKLKELSTDPKVGKADKGWIKQDMNEVQKGKRNEIRRPPGKQLAHERGREAAKGYSYKHSNLQNKKDHKTQHKYDNNGKKNKERPVN